jgi:2-dehydropantoate 2-reductase
MKICFVGAGAVGGFYGALLARTGHDVSFIARGAHRDAIQANGLRVVGPLGDFTSRHPPKAIPPASDPWTPSSTPSRRTTTPRPSR